MNKLEAFLRDLKDVIKNHDAEITQNSAFVTLNKNEVYGFYVLIDGKYYSIGKESIEEF